MDKTTIRFGITLMVIGLAAYFGSGRASATALIPAFFGMPMALMGIIASKKESFRKTAMHIASGIGVLGFAGSVPGLLKLAPLLSGAEVARPQAVIVQSIMALICGIYVVLSIRSFLAARKARNA
jgi:lysylphosphatidylglycerol synthetase-like protein (DUF2156 family)